MDWFLDDSDLRHERVKEMIKKLNKTIGLLMQRQYILPRLALFTIYKILWWCGLAESFCKIG